MFNVHLESSFKITDNSMRLVIDHRLYNEIKYQPLITTSFNQYFLVLLSKGNEKNGQCPVYC